jgi:hypothetical protein
VVDLNFILLNATPLSVPRIDYIRTSCFIRITFARPLEHSSASLPRFRSYYIRTGTEDAYPRPVVLCHPLPGFIAVRVHRIAWKRLSTRPRLWLHAHSCPVVRVILFMIRWLCSMSHEKSQRCLCSLPCCCLQNSRYPSLNFKSTFSLNQEPVERSSWHPPVVEFIK